MTPYEQIEQAYLHLCWAMKLDSYLFINPPKSKAEFDQDITVTDPKDPLFLPANQFNSMDDIHLGAENSILLSLGAFFLALDTAFDEAGYTRNVNANDFFGQLRILIYMIRCAFAHNVLKPQWEVRGDYQRNLSIRDKEIKIDLDLSTLNSKEFNINQIGLLNFFDLMVACYALIFQVR